MDHFYNYVYGPKEPTRKPLEKPSEENEHAPTTNEVESAPVDMVIVYKKIAGDDNYKLETYLDNLKVVGLDAKHESSDLLDLHAVLISAPKRLLERYSKVYGIELAKDNPNWVRVENEDSCKMWQTSLTHTKGYDELMSRAPDMVLRVRPADYTNIERIMIVSKIMENNQFVGKEGDVGYGYQSLGKNVQVYPLHESTWRWWKTGAVKDRQVLYRFWANPKCMFKIQPIFLIEKYFSTDMAFYFLFIGYYNQMLVPLTFAGLVAFVGGLLEMFISPELSEFCNLDIPVCPVCLNFNVCPITSLTEYCKSKRFALLFDNGAAVFYSVISSVWSIIYLIKWRRKQATMALRWNVSRMHYDETLRPEFRKYAIEMKISRFTQKQTVDIPISLKIRGYTISYVSIILLLSCSICLILLTSFYRHSVYILKMKFPALTHTMITISASYIYYFLVSFGICPIIKKLSRILTVLECHRTQQSYDCSKIYKQCFLTIPSFYGVMIYLSLLKGKFFVYPTDAARWRVAGAIPADTCNPAGCMIDVTIQFIVMMTTDAIKSTLHSIHIMYLNYLLKQHKVQKFSRIKKASLATRWEKDYVKTPSDRHVHSSYYTSLMISYGLITWFAAICPLGPLFAFVRNLVDLRMQAFDCLILKRRIVGMQVANIYCWNRIMIMITLFGILSNGIMITYSSTTIHRAIYAYMNNYTLKGYVRKSLTEFNTRKYMRVSGVVLPDKGDIGDVCYYRGFNIDVDDKEKFVETNLYWLHLVVQTTFLIVYENVIFILGGIIFLIVKSVPQEVRLKLNDEEEEIREKRIELLNNRYIKQNQKIPKTDYE